MSDSPLYRALWRWHFYAGLITMPFLVSLALTGGLYLFKDEIDAVVYRELLHVDVTSQASLPASTLVAQDWRERSPAYTVGVSACCSRPDAE